MRANHVPQGDNYSNKEHLTRFGSSSLLCVILVQVHPGRAVYAEHSNE